MYILISPSKIWAKKYTLYIAKYGNSYSFLSHLFLPVWYSQPEIMGTSFLGTGILGWGAWCGAGTP